MSGQRLNSVYDFSSLRLHPDGSRVSQDTSKNLRPRYAASAVRDPRGNWIARDAAGKPSVKRYRMVREDDKEEDIHLEDADKGPALFKGKDKAKEKTGRRYDPRPAKRRKFKEDLDFLTPVPPSSSSLEHPFPSSDLLKSIHYFASTYYHERGQLVNLTKEYRRKKKQRKLRRLEQRQKKADPAREALGDYEEDGEPVKPARRGGRIKGAGERVYPKDMYKILEGSALVAIGMLMQEYVARMLEVRIPDGWEAMVRQAYTNADDEPPDAATYGVDDTENVEANDREADIGKSQQGLLSSPPEAYAYDSEEDEEDGEKEGEEEGEEDDSEEDDSEEEGDQDSTGENRAGEADDDAEDL